MSSQPDPLDFDPKDEPMVAIAKGLHRIARAIEEVTGGLGTLQIGVLDVNLSSRHDDDPVRVVVEE